LDEFLPARTPVADEYPFPEYVDNPSDMFRIPEELVQRLEINEQEGYSIYWDSNLEDGPRQAMLFYTEDGAMIAGIGGPNAELNETLENVAKLVKGRYGFITSGSCTPEIREAFINICRESTLVNLFEGQLRKASTA